MTGAGPAPASGHAATPGTSGEGENREGPAPATEGDPVQGSGAADDGSEALDDLPSVVGDRLAMITLDVLPALGLDQIPLSLRPLARMRGPRVARVGRAALLAELVEESFRCMVAAEARVRSTARRSGSNANVVGGPPAQRAAEAWLYRPPGWRATLRAALAELDAGEHVRATVPPAGERAARRRDAADDAVRTERDRLRDQLTAARSDTAQWRREATAARAQAQSSADLLARTVNEHEQRERDLARRVAEAEAALRAERRRAEAAERAAAESQGRLRGERTAADVRVRLLLDVLTGATSGLRRELALPPPGQLPADREAASWAPAAAAGSAYPGGLDDVWSSLGGRGLNGNDPAVVDEVLGVPQVHMLVDGYNVTKAGFPTLSLEEQRQRLVALLAPLAASSGAELTVVFDAAAVTSRPVLATPTRGLRVLFSPVGRLADDIVVALVDAEPPGRPLAVVTNDQALRRRVRARGARPVASEALLARIGRT